MLENVNKLLGFQKAQKDTGITPELIKTIIEEVENDPYAGIGAISKKALLVDKLYAAWRMHSCLARGVPITQARLIVNEPPVEQAPSAQGVRVQPPKKPADPVLPLTNEKAA